ncbi:hypothetical protein [Cellulomonas sp. HZM]|uniref:hypothetical protein n=1 Tax=Cellulomonas sp. HZM TaxID=1454010 RepID=UPI0004938341|nr:hypothetical protein [Cellulomonas sp. HZM]
MRHVARQVSPHSASELLYGAIVTASVLAVSSLHPGPGGHVVLAAGVVTLVYWLAHVYVDAVGGRFLDPEHSTTRRLGHALRSNWGVLLGGVPPIVVYVVARLLGASVPGAAWVAMWFTVGLLMTAGGFAAYRAGRRGFALVSEIAVCGCFGLAVIAMKYALH